MTFLPLLLAAIELTGVTGYGLKARAFFDANNVKVGDPLVLTVDFLGEADFSALHPPALAKLVDRRDWKVDDASAKTDTFRDARRITYRVRPMREGLLRFPELEFVYESRFRGMPKGPVTVKSNSIPVHARAGTQVKVAEMGEADELGYPKPPPFVTESGAELSADEAFAWRKALVKPRADAFARFSFPAGRMNEATAAINEGNWARALTIYSWLEWRTGQTPEIERGMIAALALKYENPNAELPVWRQVMRPLLVYAWPGRVGIVLGAFALIALVFWLLGRGIRAIACLGVALTLSLGAWAETTETKTVTTNADGSVTIRTERRTVSATGFTFVSTKSSTTGGSGGTTRIGGGNGGGLFGGGDPFAELFGGRSKATPKFRLRATMAPAKTVYVPGERIDLILSIDMPKHCQFPDGPSVQFAQRDGIDFDQPYALSDADSPTEGNVVRRYCYPVYAERPMSGTVTCTVTADYISSQVRGFFEWPRMGFRQIVRSAPFEVSPFPAEGRPADFSGIVAENVGLHEFCDLLRVETNDVVTITYRLSARGQLPHDLQLPGADFEWGRDKDSGVVEFRRFFVADGVLATPETSVVYFDPKKRTYRRVSAGGTRLVYVADREDGK